MVPVSEPLSLTMVIGIAVERKYGEYLTYMGQQPHTAEVLDKVEVKVCARGCQTNIWEYD